MNKTTIGKKIAAGMATIMCFAAFSMFAQQPTTSINLPGSSIISFSKNTGLPNLIRLEGEQTVPEPEFTAWLGKTLNLPDAVTFRSYNVEKDQLGYTHTRYREYVNNIPVNGSMIITHSKGGRIEMINGDYFLNMNLTNNVTVSEENALASALKKVNAKKYKWENKEEEAAKKIAFNQPDYTYYPKGELVIVHKAGADYSSSSMRLAYKFNIYAEEPLSRAYIFVDAITNNVIAEEQIIHTGDVVGTGVTKFSGTVPMTSDNFGAGQYRLRETGRGLGIQTYNLNHSSSYTNTDFTNTTANWNLAGADQAAADAHWGAEMTYDYYSSVHSRNSIDNAGYALLSYVHYSTNFVNAYWDGQEMTYGDGQVSQGFLIMTALDVCGHEITHGLTSFTANLNGGGSGEPDALNEAFSDIFGTTIEAYARPSNHDWIMGADITCNTSGVQDHIGLRDMSHPSNLGQPNCYLGTSWDPNGEPHNNDGPCIWWYYLLCQGGSGTNDLGNAYNVTGITMDEARLIAYRGLTNYFTSATTYADARTYTIQAAMDLYGGCSPEVIATTNAWHAVGVGAAYAVAPTSASFTASATSSCTVPFTVTFANTSVNATTAAWDFGDGSTGNVLNPTHVYTTAGTYNVKLSVSSACGADSVLQTSFITITLPSSPSATAVHSCTSPASLTLNATGSGNLVWYAAPAGGSALTTGTSYTTPSLSSATTYYVESQIPGSSGNVGPVSTSFGTGGLHNNTSVQYLIFDVLKACTIQSVLVNSGAAGSRNVMLWDNTGAVLQTIPVNFISGTSTVTLNIHLNPGTGYRLGGTSMNLYRNNAGASYPYTLNGVITMTGSSAGSAYYYYYYNWLVQADPCISARTAVDVTFGGPTVTYTIPAIDSLCTTASPVVLIGGSPAGGTYSGTGVSSGNFDPSVAGTGTHTITYSYTDNNSCSSTATQNLYVVTCSSVGINNTDISSGIVIYPNPSGGIVNIEIGSIKDEKAEIRVMNMIGQIILAEHHDLISGNNKAVLQLTNVAKGVYTLEVKTGSGINTKRIVIN